MGREQYEVRWKDYYELLGVRQDANTDTIRRVWRRLSQVYHPDVTGDTAVNPERMSELNEAYEVLSNLARRARYDEIYRIRRSGFDPGPTNDAYEKGNAYSSSYDDADEEDWYANRESEQASDNSGEYAQEARSHGSSYEYQQEPVPVLSFSFLRLLFSRLLDKVCPHADESQRIMPWPSWSWQRLFLIGSIPLGLLLFGVAAVNASWPFVIFAFLLSGASVYAGAITRWMRATKEAPLPAKIAGGTSITISGVSFALGVAYVIFVIVIMVLVLIFTLAMLRAMLAEAFRRYLR